MFWCYSPKHYNLTEGDSSAMVVSFHLGHHFGPVHAALLGGRHPCLRALGQQHTDLQGPAPALGSSALSTLAQCPGGLCWCLQRVGFDPASRLLPLLNLNVISWESCHLGVLHFLRAGSVAGRYYTGGGQSLQSIQ